MQALAEETFRAVDGAVRSLHVNTALAELWKLVRAVNKYIDEARPWALAKEGDSRRLGTVMYHVFEALRIIAVLVTPFMPRTGQAFWQQLGQSGRVEDQGLAASAWGGSRPGTAVQGGEPLFPRLDVDQVLEELLGEAAEKDQGAAGGAQDGGAPGTRGGATGPSGVNVTGGTEGLITIDEFAKVQLKVAKVLEAEKVKGADKLLKLRIDLGSETRQIVAGIAQHYSPEELVGRSIVVVANLQPAKLRGEVSEGMLLAASDESGRLALLTVDREIAPGSAIR